MIPRRTCAGCGNEKERSAFLRIVRSPEGRVSADPSGKAQGRGLYICRSVQCLEKAKKRKAFSRSLRMQIPDELFDEILKELQNG